MDATFWVSLNVVMLFLGIFMLTLLRCLKPAAHESYSAELTVTRAYWRKQVLPVCGEILRVFRHARQKSLEILPRTREDFAYANGHE